MRNKVMFSRAASLANRSLVLFCRRSASTKGYQSIGSFHSDNLEELMKTPDEIYVPPHLPFSEKVCEGNIMLDLENWTFLNHGAFGAALDVGYHRAAQWRQYLEEQPLRYFDRDLLPHLAYSTRRMVDFIQLANRENITLLQNTTSGCNTLISGYCREYGPELSQIVLWDTSYGSVKKMAHHYSHYSGGKVTEIPFQKQYLDRVANAETDVEIKSLLREAVEQALSQVKGKHPLVILDHITSNTALTFPVEELARHIKEFEPNAVVLVDGAHGLLSQPLDMHKDTAIDFYVSNCHKWLSAPRGVAMMATNDFERWNDSILRLPAVISHGVDAPDFLSRFLWDGCRDYAAALALPAVLDHWESLGADNVRKQMRAQMLEGVQILVDSWHSDFSRNREAWSGNVTLASIDSFLLSSPLLLVKLPEAIIGTDRKTSTHAKQIQDYLYANNIEVPIKCINGKLYVRVSCHVYNQSKDFDMLARSMLEFNW